MRDECLLDLAACTEYRQALQARPPAIVHGTALLLAATVAAALAWSAATEADLVVLAPGRVRPSSRPMTVTSLARGDDLSAGVGGRVSAVRARAGDEVRRGDVLVRMGTERLDNQIAQQERAIRDAEQEAARLAAIEALSFEQFEAARAKAEAELKRAQAEVHRTQQHRAAELRRARAALEAAGQERDTTQGLVRRGAVPPADLIQAAVKFFEAQEQFTKAQIPINEGSVEVARRALDLMEREQALAREQLAMQRAAKLAEGEAARIELANLGLVGAHAILRSPVDGVVTTGDVKVGDVLEPGATVVEIAPRGELIFEATVPSAEVGHLRPGMPVRIKLDAYDSQRYGTLEGSVGFISPDSGPVAGPAGAVLYTVTVRLARHEVGRGRDRGRVKLGMAGRAEIVTGRRSLLALLAGQIRRTISFG